MIAGGVPSHQYRNCACEWLSANGLVRRGQTFLKKKLLEEGTPFVAWRVVNAAISTKLWVIFEERMDAKTSFRSNTIRLSRRQSGRTQF